MDIDTRLRRLAGGALAPAASTANVQFSNGGEGPFAILRRGGHTFTLSWPSSLPVPVLAGDSATYAGVLPDVDLVVRAIATGFTHVVVIKTPAAAANPAVRRVRLSVGGDVAVSTTPEGGLRVAAGATVVASAGGAVMWDSSVSAGNVPQARSSSSAPAEGARMAAVEVQVTGGGLDLVPARDVLANGVFPLFVDPDFSTGEQTFAYANSSNANVWPYPDPAPRPGTAGEVGGYQLRAGINPTSGPTYRGFLQFPMVAGGFDLRGRRIFSGKLAGRVDHTWKCGATREVRFYRSAAIATTPRQTWPGPALQGSLGSLFTKANEQDCSEPNDDFEIGLTADLQGQASASAGTYTMAVISGNEGNSEYWFRFFLDTFFLLATFNSKPNVATGLDTATKGCSTGAARPYIGTTKPGLKARVSDPDNDVDLSAEYAWDTWNVSTNAWDRIGNATKANLASNTDVTLTLGVDPGSGGPLEHGKRYRWAVQVIDPFSGGSDPSGWSSWCEFEVDTDDPDLPPDVSSPVYKQDGNYHGSIGLTADFTFTPQTLSPGDVADVAGFLWGWSDPPTTYLAAPSIGSPVTKALTPPPPDPANPTLFGQLTLYVRSVDRAGNQGPRRNYGFLIGSASGPAASWDLSEAAGATSLVDSSGGGHHATPTAVTTGTPGRLLSGPAQTAPTSASFNGASSYASTGSPVFDTSQSFSVAVWVRPDANNNGWRALLSATGSMHGSFFLRRDPTNHWNFTLVAADNGSTTWDEVAGTSTSAVGVWTHLVAVYDAGAGQARLYVNGVLESTAATLGAFSAPGALEIGRALWAGSWTNHLTWHGAMADVNVWNRVLATGEISPLAATQAGWWTLDGHGFDDSGWGRDATPNNVSWVNDRVGNPGAAAAFNGTTSGLATTVPAVRSDQSHTVALWVRLTAPTGWATAVSQRGVRESALIMQRDSGRWAMAAHLTDMDAPVTVRASSLTVSQNAWTHLVGVYDAQAGLIKLYVNGDFQQATPYRATWNAAGPVLIGHEWHHATIVSRWTGDLDDVRVFAGAMPDMEIRKLYES